MIIVIIVRINLLFTQILSILILSIWQVLKILLFFELCYFIFVKLSYFEFGLKCMHFFWSVKNLFSRKMLYFCWIILFWIWVKDLKCMHCFLGCKKIISRWMLYLILCKLKWVVLHSCQPNTTSLLSVLNGLGQANPPY